MTTETTTGATTGSPSRDGEGEQGRPADNGRAAVLTPEDAPALAVAVPARKVVTAPPVVPGVRRAPATGKPTPWGLSLVVLVAGMFMSVLDISIVNVAIPTIQNDFGVPLDDIQWISTSYALAEGVVVPVSAWLGLRFGLKRCYVWALLAFTVASALCGFAWDLNSMIAFRVIQAIPGGVLPVVALTMLYKVVPREKIGGAMGLFGLGIVVAPAVGPTLGGYLVEYVDWRLIFFINIPIGVLGAIAALAYLPTFSGARAHRFDVPGFLAIGSGLFALLIALDQGEDWGWTSYPVLILVAYGVLALALFIVIELEVDHPLLNVRVFATFTYSNALFIIAVIMMGMFGVLFFIPQSLQTNQGLGAFETGIVLLPQALTMAVIMPIAGRIYDRIGARWPAVIGLSFVAYGTWLLHDVTIDTSHSELAWILAMRAGGVALAMMPIMTSGMSSLPPDRVDNASAFNTVVQRTSSAVGLAALSALMTGFQAQGMSDRTSLLPTDGSTAASGSMVERYGMYQQIETRVFDTGFSNLMIATTALTLVAVVLAFFLPARLPSAGGSRAVEM